jgi:predicted enzyme related to lactoylglutathione lyase
MAQSDNHGRFAWHELMTSDVAAARSFYETVVGWTTSTWGDGSVDYMMWMAGEVPVGGLMRIPSGDPSAPPPNWLTYIAVNHVDDVVEATTRAGGSVILPARTVPGVGRFAVLRDPQGAAFGAITGEGELPPETDPKPLEFSWHELVTTDYKAAAEFYEKVFGWVKQSEFDMGDMGTYYMFGRDRFTYGGMMNTLPGMDAPPYWLHYAQVSDSADAAAERAKAAGGTIVQGPMEVPGGDRICVIVDPQGASFAVHSKAPVAAPDFKPAGADSVRA